MVWARRRTRPPLCWSSIWVSLSLLVSRGRPSVAGNDSVFFKRGDLLVYSFPPLPHTHFLFCSVFTLYCPLRCTSRLEAPRPTREPGKKQKQGHGSGPSFTADKCRRYLGFEFGGTLVSIWDSLRPAMSFLGFGASIESQGLDEPRPPPPPIYTHPQSP